MKIPPPCHGWPTSWISKTDYYAYLRPLLYRGWYLAPTPTQSTVLARSFTFHKPSVATRFSTEILNLTALEKHHPQWLNIACGASSSRVSLGTTTHSASNADNRIVPGITLRDVRFAALVASLPSAPAEHSDALMDELDESKSWMWFQQVIHSWPILDETHSRESTTLGGSPQC
ncbi:hypothetical protein MKEN_00331500 [Mycena kentingensis (nom. inval.)]|nr:hypothetical protein MKEN_00331500 [Mycena kentingensis (nom. inval.)]